ncbi:hypothetical protein BHQ17_01450 [Mycolicibacterium holsaticum]|uniref:Uncharacterized protein n=1 Tax=Mycolicibacterium holsaticum TaxID=152142 RepID=A0A1E3S2G8_9MYCO|nr:hypothetical protein BHQ17_01450 [Mycolicibacterium holsaticum]
MCTARALKSEPIWNSSHRDPPGSWGLRGRQTDDAIGVDSTIGVDGAIDLDRDYFADDLIGQVQHLNGAAVDDRVEPQSIAHITFEGSVTRLR